MRNIAIRSQTLSQARALLRLDSSGFPVVRNSHAVVTVIHDVLRTLGTAAMEELIVNGLFRDSPSRYDEHVALRMRAVEPCRFVMGTAPDEVRHFCGESPAHVVELSGFRVSEVPVTNELFAHFDRRLRDVPAHDRQKPVVGVSWCDAVLFAAWMGCRLPTEAEWEFACAAGSASEWCCEDEVDLQRYAWYSMNSEGLIHDVGSLDPNGIGLFDLHGNVWEWCLDTYDQDFYASSSSVDPINVGPAASVGWGSFPQKVCRGGSVHSLSEMCRTRFRLHDPADYSAADLGFRLVKSGTSGES